MGMYLYALLKATVQLAVLSTICGVVVLGSIIIPSDWTEPRDICIFVEGTGGLLPVNPNEGGSIVYSCDVNWRLASFYIAVFGLPLGLVCFVILCAARALVQRRRHKYIA